MNERDERMIRNEALFREVNERLREVGANLSPEGEFVCECSEVTCAERIAVSTAEYEAVRARPGHFLLVQGHEEPSIERVVEQHDGWLVTRKSDADLEEAAVEPDPRAG